jgi:predicted RNA polymerase sigma factor
VLDAVYLIFNERYAATDGDDVLRPELVEDALRLGRMLARLMPHETEVRGLVALMEIQASRIAAPALRWLTDPVARSRPGQVLTRAERLGPLGPCALHVSWRCTTCSPSSHPHPSFDEPVLKTYHLLPSVRTDLLLKMGRSVEAGWNSSERFSLAVNARDRAF